MDEQKKLFDDETYAAMCVPFESAEEADQALAAFWAGVYELRCKCRLANVSVIVKDSVRGAGNSCGTGTAAVKWNSKPWPLGISGGPRRTARS